MMKKSLIAVLLVVIANGCSVFQPTEPKTKVLIVPSDEYMVKMTYTNRFDQAIEGYFVPNSKMEEFAEMKKELEFFRSPEYKMYKRMEMR